MTLPTPDSLQFDHDEHETRLRAIVAERLALAPPPSADQVDAVVATYYLALRSIDLDKAAREIAYHATSGIKSPPPGSLLERCTAVNLGSIPFDGSRRVGLLHVAFPLEMLLDEDGALTSTDLLHTAASAVIFDMYENRDAKLVRLDLPTRVLKTFPGPAHGPEGARRKANYPSGVPAFGTILKPTAGITAEDVGRIVAGVADCPLLMFIKEDENLYPRLPYSRAADRVRAARESIARAMDRRGGRGIVFLPHCTGAPHQIADTVSAAVEAGADGVMFSESFALGAVRLVREATKGLADPPLIYGHNAGIGVRTRGGIVREIIDFLARLDGIDFRQTAPVRSGVPYIRPFGEEWRASEAALADPIPGVDIKPVMISRAGGLDQGNILLNIEDARAAGRLDGILFLAGSAINSITDDSGRLEPRLGVESLLELEEVRLSGAMEGVSASEHLAALRAAAEARNLKALLRALDQRYPNRA